MKKHTLKYWGLFCMLMLMACQQQDADETETLAEASLTVTFKMAAIQASSRAVDEDLTGDGMVDELDQVVDGQRMYRLAIALVDNGTIIASAELKKDDGRFNADKDEATVTFNQLQYGKTYQLIAVANYGDYDTNITGNLANVNDLTGTINVTANNVSKLCPKNSPYPLSLKKEIMLQPGANTVTGELLRTYARLRIHVRNQNQGKTLKITGLTLGNKFTQPAADLFVSGGTATTKPDVISNDAITPFVNSTTVDANIEKTIFDAYLLESVAGDYTYTLDLEYDGPEITVYEVANDPIKTTGDIEDGAMYVIYNYKRNNGRYLYADGQKVSTSNSYSSNGAVNPNNVWRFEKTGNGNNYYIESMGADGYFIQSSKVSNSNVPMSAERDNDDYLKVSVDDNQYLLFQSTNDNRYLSVDNNGNVGGVTKGDTRRFYLYKVTTNTQREKVRHTETIPISTIHKETGEAIPVTAIKRNDFINILVNVNYNEKSGKFKFEVIDWEKKEGVMEFN